MRAIEAATLRRLPRYHQILRRVAQHGRQYVSSDYLARELNVDASVVRKDLVSVATGVQKLGYHVLLTLEKIENLLGMRNSKEAFLAGAGSLGRALMAYPGFERYGLRITAAFDVDPAKVGETVGGVQVLPVDKLGDLMRRMGIQIGIVAVPADAAQEVVNTMVGAGAMAIWNFAPVTLQVPSNVIVRDENLAAGFALLSYALERKMNERSGSDAGSCGFEPADRDSVDDDVPAFSQTAGAGAPALSEGE